MPDLIKSSEFKVIRKQADEYAKKKGFQRWPSRVAWFCLVYGPFQTAKIVQRRDFDKSGKASRAFHHLLTRGRISVVDDGIYYEEGDDKGATLEWYDGLILDAIGPDSFSS